MTTDMKPFDFTDLPDKFAHAEALWLLMALAHTLAVAWGYTVIQRDQTAAVMPLRAADCLERCIRRAYPESEAQWLIALARAKAKEGLDRQRVSNGDETA